MGTCCNKVTVTSYFLGNFIGNCVTFFSLVTITKLHFFITVTNFTVIFIVTLYTIEHDMTQATVVKKNFFTSII